MKIDLYSRIILTVIAICLVYIVAKDVSFVQEAQAGSLSSASDTVDVNIVKIGGKHILYGDSIPVEIDE